LGEAFSDTHIPTSPQICDDGGDLCISMTTGGYCGDIVVIIQN